MLQAIHLDPSNYIYHSNRSACHALKGEHSKAKKDAEECIRLNPDFVKGYYRRVGSEGGVMHIEAGA